MTVVGSPADPLRRTLEEVARDHSRGVPLYVYGSGARGATTGPSDGELASLRLSTELGGEA